MSDLRDDISKYLRNELSPGERHALEKRALHDPFLAEALEGAEQISGDEFAKDLDDLRKGVLSKATKPIFTPFRIAAAILLLVTAGVVVFQFSENQKPESLSFQNKTPQPELAGDSVSGFIAENNLDSIVGELDTEVPVDKVDAKAKKSESISTRPQLADAEKINETAGLDDIKDEVKPTAQPTQPKQEALIAQEEAMVALAEDTTPVEGETKEVKKDVATEPVAKTRVSTESLRRSKSMAQSAASLIGQTNIKGRVTSMEDASPLPGVNVIIKGSTVGTITDARGGFQIDTDFTEPTLVFSFIGLESQEVNVKNRQDTISVQLQQDVSQLSEVVVTGYGVSTRDNSESSVNYPTLQLANPEVGKESFQDYLKLNVNYPKDAIDNKVEGRVTVQFLVTREGQLNDFTIIRGIGFGCDEELIRLIEAGPKWIPTSRNGIALDEKVKVRFKFELPR